MTTLLVGRSLLLGAVLFLGACGEKAAPPPEPLRPVLTTVIGAGADNSRAVTYSGEVRSRYETPLGFRIPGKVSARLVDAGALVKAGDVLARLDPADTALSAASANAQLELADADLRRYRECQPVGTGRQGNYVQGDAGAGRPGAQSEFLHRFAR